MPTPNDAPAPPPGEVERLLREAILAWGRAYDWDPKEMKAAAWHDIERLLTLVGLTVARDAPLPDEELEQLREENRLMRAQRRVFQESRDRVFTLLRLNPDGRQPDQALEWELEQGHIAFSSSRDAPDVGMIPASSYDDAVRAVGQLELNVRYWRERAEAGRDAPSEDGLLATVMELDAVAADLDAPHGPNSCSVYVFERQRVIRWRESLRAYLAASRQAEKGEGNQ